MPIDSIGGFSSGFDMQAYGNDPGGAQQDVSVQQAAQYGPTDAQTFGAAVVSKTMDYLNGQGSPGLDMAPVDTQTFGAAVVSKTLDYMNSGHSPSSGMEQSYDFQKSVLGGHADAIGSLANIKV